MSPNHAPAVAVGILIMLHRIAALLAVITVMRLGFAVSTVRRSFLVRPVFTQIMVLLLLIVILLKHMLQLLSLPLLRLVHPVRTRGQPSRRVDQL